MKFIDIILIGAAFILSVTVSFFSRRLSWGLFFPPFCFAFYLLLAGAKSGGAGLGILIALMLMKGIPIGLASIFGALLGETLAKRFNPENTNSPSDPDR